MPCTHTNACIMPQGWPVQYKVGTPRAACELQCNSTVLPCRRPLTRKRTARGLNKAPLPAEEQQAGWHTPPAAERAQLWAGMGDRARTAELSRHRR